MRGMAARCLHGIQIEGGYKVDLLIQGTVVVELKVVEHLLEVHKAQLLSYLKLSGKELGLLINFNVVHLKDGIKRTVNTRPSASSAYSAVWFDVSSSPIQNSHSTQPLR